MGSPARADDVNRAIDAGEETGQRPFAGGCLPDDHFPLFLLRMFGVVAIDRMAIREDGGCFVKGDIVFLYIPDRFFRVPVEFEWFPFCHAKEYSIPNLLSPDYRFPLWTHADPLDRHLCRLFDHLDILLRVGGQFFK
jgi:hypothetical protein